MLTSTSMHSTGSGATQQICSGTPAFRKANLALFCAGFVTFITLYDVQPLLPLFAREFTISPAASSLPLSISTITLAVGMLIAGTLSETFGRRIIMTTALFATSLLALATFFIHSFEILLLLRILQGIALAGVPSVAMAYLGEEMDAHSVGHAMGLYISGNALGGMTGRIGTALLCDHLPWQQAISLIGLISLLLTLVFIKSLPPSRNFRTVPFVTGNLISTLYQHLKDPGLTGLFALAFLTMGGFVSLYNYIGFRLLSYPYNLSQSQVSLIFLVYLLGSFSSGVAGRLMQRFGRNLMVRSMLIIMLFGTLITLWKSLFPIIFGVGIYTCGFFSAHAIASSWVGKRAQSAKAQASSLYLFSYYLGSSISGTAGGIFWEHFGWIGVVCMISALLLTALGVLSRLHKSFSSPDIAVKT